MFSFCKSHPMVSLFKPKQIISLHLDKSNDVSTQDNILSWDIPNSQNIVLSKNARIFLNELKAKNSGQNYIKLYSTNFLDDTDAYDSYYQSSYGALLFTLPLTTTTTPYQFPDTGLIVSYDFNNNFVDSVNGYDFAYIPLDNSTFTFQTQTINTTTTTYLRIGDELTFPSSGALPNIYNIISSGNYTIDFSMKGSIDLKDSNGMSALPSGFVKNDYVILKDGSGNAISPWVWYKFDGSSLADMLIDSSGNNRNATNVGTAITVDSTIYAKGTSSILFNSSASNNYIKRASGFNVPMSICFWFRLINTTNYTMVSLTDKASNNPCIQFDTNNGTKLNVYTALDNFWTIGLEVTGLTRNVWYHCVYTLSNTNPVNAKLYVDAGTSLSANGNANKILPTAGITEFVIGASGDSYRGANVYIDDFRVYQTVLTTEQVSELYTGSVQKYFQELTVFTETFEYDDTRTDKGLYTWSVPEGVDEVTAYVWGAGGGGCGESSGGTIYNGGAGGFIKANINVSGMSSIKIVVGEGGKGSVNSGALLSDGNTNNGGWGGGGYGKAGNNNWSLGGGGGLSGIFGSSGFAISSGIVNSTSVSYIVCGAGGGGGGASSGTMKGGGGGNGAPFTNGKTGGNDSDVHNGRGGGTAGGIAGDGAQGDGIAGSKFRGADGVSTSFSGGGGAGYFGGGSGGLSNGIVGGGGGGSSYWGNSAVTYIVDVGGDNGSTTAPDTAAYVSGISVPSTTAQGGATSSTFNGGNGFIAIQYTRQVYYNDFTFTELSPYGYVLQSFDDTPDRIRATVDEVHLYQYGYQTGITITFDMKITGYNSSGVDLILRTENNDLLIRGRDNGDLEFRFLVSNTISTVENVYLISNTWYNFAIVNNTTTNRFFLNGIERPVIDADHPLDVDIFDGLIIGEFVGNLATLKIYNVALDIQPTIVSNGNAIINYQNAAYRYQRNYKVNERLLSGGQRLNIRLVDGVKSDIDELQMNWIIYDEILEKQEDTRDYDADQSTNKIKSNFYK